jgi:hypothetical protein
MSFFFFQLSLLAGVKEKVAKIAVDQFEANPPGAVNHLLKAIDFINNNLEKLPLPEKIPLHSDSLNSYLASQIELLGPMAQAVNLKGNTETWGKDFANFYKHGDAKATTKFGLQTLTVGYGATLLLFPSVFPLGVVGIGLSVSATAATMAHNYIDGKDAITVASYMGAKHLKYRTNYTLNQWSGKTNLGSKEEGYHSNAYLGCEYSDDDGDVDDDWWEWVNKKNIAHLYPPTEGGKTKNGNLSYYGKTMQLKGRWISVPTKNEDIWVFGTLQNPLTLAGICLEIIKNKILETRESIDSFDPKNVRFSVGDYKQKHEIIHYARDKELSARKGDGYIYYSQVNFNNF